MLCKKMWIGSYYLNIWKITVNANCSCQSSLATIQVKNQTFATNNDIKIRKLTTSTCHLALPVDMQQEDYLYSL